MPIIIYFSSGIIHLTIFNALLQNLNLYILSINDPYPLETFSTIIK